MTHNWDRKIVPDRNDTILQESHNPEGLEPSPRLPTCTCTSEGYFDAQSEKPRDTLMI